MFDGSCTSCSEIKIVVPGSQNGTNGEHFVEFFEWGNSVGGMVSKFMRKMEIVDAINLLKQQIVVLKSHLFTKSTQLECCNTIKENLKQSDLLIQVNYSQNYDSKHQNEVQSAYFGQNSFSIFTACCYFQDETNSLAKQAITVTSESSDQCRKASISCLLKIINFMRETHSHLPLKLNVIIWSDACASQFHSRFVFKLLSTFESSINLSWFYNERHHGKGTMDGVGGAMKNAVYRDVKSGKVTINNAK